MNLLLVDDEPRNLSALSALLEAIGARVHCARSGEEALREVLRRDYAAILLGVRMPGADGFRTAAAIRTVEHSRRTPIIFVSAHGDRRARPRDPHSEFLRTPLDVESVRARVKACLSVHNDSGPM
jgi:DNA-binding response OmpR family regulator